jgi:hypothetical protein
MLVLGLRFVSAAQPIIFFMEETFAFSVLRTAIKAAAIEICSSGKC